MLEIGKIKNTILNGHVLDVIKNIPDKSVDMVITSPPYFALRNYETSSRIWGGDIDCEHEWVDIRKVCSGGLGHKQDTSRGSWYDRNVKYCMKCTAYKGELGLEPFFGNKTIEVNDKQLIFRGYISHLVDIFDEVKRVLKPTGTFFLNIGDTYYGGNKNEGGLESALRNKQGTNKGTLNIGGSLFKNKELPDKCLCMIPQRIAIEMVDRGWILRNNIVWHKCLVGSTYYFVKQNNRYKFLRLDELYKEYDDTYVLTQDMKMNQVWVKIKNIFYNGKQPINKITTKSGREIISTGKHGFVYSTNSIQNVNAKYRKINIKAINDFNVNDKLYVNTDIGNIGLPSGDSDDYDIGFTVGFYIAEGNKIKKKLKSLKIREKGIQLSCGIGDHKYLDIISKHFKIKRYPYGNKLAVRSYDKELLKIVNKYVDGDVCHLKKLKDDAFNNSLKFLNGIIDGFCCGDGHDDNIGRYRVNIKPNYILMEQFQLICRIINYDFRFESEKDVQLKDKTFKYFSFSIRNKKKYRRKHYGIMADTVESIVDNGIDDVYDVELEPLYTGRIGNQYKYIITETKEIKKKKFNHLYFLANGVWTHNSNAFPNPARDRFGMNWENVFLFSKKSKYYFEQQFESCAGTERTQDVFSDDYVDDKLTRIKRCVWSIPIEPFSAKSVGIDYTDHFASFPKKLIESPIKAGCPKFVCKKCGEPRFPIYTTEKSSNKPKDPNDYLGAKKGENTYTDCSCSAGFEPGTVLDIFMGTGTTAVVSSLLKRNWIGIEISPEYCHIAQRRLEVEARKSAPQILDKDGNEVKDERTCEACVVEDCMLRVFGEPCQKWRIL